VAPEVLMAFPLLIFPMFRGFETLNLEPLLFSCMILLAGTAPKSRWVDLGLGLVCGFLLGIKPYWLAAALPVLVLRGRYFGAAGVLAGLGTLVAVSVATSAELWMGFLRKAAMAAKHGMTPDLWNIDFKLGIVGVLIWTFSAYLVWRRDHEDAWIYAFTAIIIWPRIVIYSYLILIPVIMYLIARRGRCGWFLVLCYSIPVALSAQLQWETGYPVLDVGAPSGLIGSGFYWAVAFATTGYLFGIVGRREHQGEPS
jgi:hypothetical protein